MQPELLQDGPASPRVHKEPFCTTNLTPHKTSGRAGERLTLKSQCETYEGPFSTPIKVEKVRVDKIGYTNFPASSSFKFV
jgi:hypothetical protein